MELTISIKCRRTEEQELEGIHSVEQMFGRQRDGEVWQSQERAQRKQDTAF
jgi:hypothetical protein